MMMSRDKIEDKLEELIAASRLNELLNKKEAEEEDIVVPVKSSGVAGKVIGSICLVGGIALVVVAALMIVGII